MNIKKCTKCGSEVGYYVRHQTGGSMRKLYNFEGVPITEQIITNNSIKSGTIGYCIECNNKVIKDVYKR